MNGFRSLKSRVLGAVALVLTVGAAAASPAMASPVVNHLGDYEYSNDSTVYYAPCCVSGTASANRVEILTINARTSSSAQPPTPTIRTYDTNFNFVTDSRFHLIDVLDYDTVGTTDRYSTFVFAAEIGSTPPIGGQIQVDFGTTTLDKYDYTLDEVSGLDTSTYYAGLKQDNTVVVNAASLSLSTLSWILGSNDLLYSVVARSVNGDVTPDAAFTEIADENSSSFIGLETASRVGGAGNCNGGASTCSASSWATSARAAGFLMRFTG